MNLTSWRIILALFIFYWSSSMAFNIIQLKKQFATSVATPYRSAVKLLAYQILKPLAINPVPKTVSNITVTSLKSNVDAFYDHLKSADSTLDRLKTEVDRSINSLVAQQSQVEKDLSEWEDKLSKNNIEYQKVENQLSEVQTKLDKAHENWRGSVDTYCDAQRDAERFQKTCLLSGTFNCHIHRKKRFLGIDELDALLVSIVPGAPVFCATARFITLNTEKDKFELARKDYKDAKKRFDEMMDKKYELLTLSETLEQEKNVYLIRKKETNDKLGKLQNLQQEVAKTGVSLKRVLQHISTLSGSGYVLKNTVEQLIEMNEMILPLQSIGDQITAFAGDAHLSFCPLTNIQASIAKYIPEVEKKLPHYPFIDF